MSGRRMRRFTLAALVVLSGCAVSTDEHAREVDARVDDVFVPVVDPDGGDDSPSDTEVVLWLVDETGLRPSARVIDAGTPSPSVVEILDAALRELFDGPRARDADAGLRSALPPGTRLLDVALTGPVATIEVSSEITRVGGVDEVRAIAQIVLTATGVPGVQRVRFVVDDEPIQVPVGTGALTSRSVTAADYEELVGG